MTLADRITVSRMLAAPLAFGAAVIGSTGLYTAIVVYGLFSDAVDGAVARALKHASAQGARMDSLADVAFYSASVLGLAALFPLRLAAEWKLFAIATLAYVVPMFAAWCKFGRITSYHTVLDRMALVVIPPAVFVWLWSDTIFPLQTAAGVLVLAALEELFMTWRLQEPRDNVAHLFQLGNSNFRRRKECV
jgi:phosphatidylglycerophosphate synthase